VWLNVNDIRAFVTPSTYERRLRQLVHELRRGGATRVLVANTPPLDELPALPSFVPDVVANEVVGRYNQAVARVVEDEGAVLVDLHAVGEAAEKDGTFRRLIAADGFHPSTAGHAAAAKAFAAAWRRAAKVR
jgi:lysophospholipase L1-like esterase